MKKFFNMYALYRWYYSQTDLMCGRTVPLIYELGNCFPDRAVFVFVCMQYKIAYARPGNGKYASGPPLPPPRLIGLASVGWRGRVMYLFSFPS